MTLREVTSSARESGAKALVPFFTAGYPDEATFVDLLNAAADAGSTAIEVGIPFSDPIADGPAIQESSEHALRGGMSLERALGLSAEWSARADTPLAIMSYVNPILSYGLQRFATAAESSGVSGLIVPDVPVEESDEIRRACARHAPGLSYINLVAPTSGGDRIDRLAAGADGFLYLVSLTGVTGARIGLAADLAADLAAFIDRVRAKASVPLYVGFGVSTPDQAKAVSGAADGVIIGSRLIQIIKEARGRTETVRNVGAFLQSVRAAIDRPAH